MAEAQVSTAYGIVDISTVDTRAQRLLERGGRALTAAARGGLPGIKPGDSATLVTALTSHADEAIRAAATQTLQQLPAPLVTEVLRAEPPVQPAVVTALSRHHGRDQELLQLLLAHPELTTASLEALAAGADESAGELIATNEARLLGAPAVIEKLYMNKHVRMSTADRLLELAVRHGLELSLKAYREMAEAISNQLIPEASAQPQPGDVLFTETDAIAEKHGSESDTHDVDDEGEESLKPKFTSLYQRIIQMSVTEKIRRATLGAPAERNLLVRDSNRLVAVAAAKSPLIREPEARLIAGSKAVHTDVLREIASNRELIRSYPIKEALVTNPKTPFTYVARLIPHIRHSELRQIAKSKHVTSNVQRAARQQLERKKH